MLNIWEKNNYLFDDFILFYFIFIFILFICYDVYINDYFFINKVENLIINKLFLN